MSEDGLESSLLIASIRQRVQVESAQLEGRFLTEMAAARLRPQAERLEIIARYSAHDFYIRAKALLAALLVSKWRWVEIEKRVEQEIEGIAAVHAGHPLCRDIALDNATLVEWIAKWIRRSNEWHQILRHMHTISTANLSREALLRFLNDWAGIPASNKNLSAPLGSAVPNQPAAPVAGRTATRQSRGRPRKYTDAQYEVAQRRKDAGESYRQIASSVFKITNPTPQDGRRVAAWMGVYRKRKDKK